MKKQAPPKAEKTLDDFFSELESKNQTVASWARERGFDVSAVYLVTRGRVKGERGEAREILLAMGVTPPPMFGRGRAVRPSAAA